MDYDHGKFFHLGKEEGCGIQSSKVSSVVDALSDKVILMSLNLLIMDQQIARHIALYIENIDRF